MKSYYQQINEIKQDVGRIANHISKRLAEQAEKDLVKSFDMIIDDYYADYNPKSYRRHGIGGLYGALQSHTVRHLPGKRRNAASITVSPLDMDDHYKGNRERGFRGSESVFDLVWNKGVRGLPSFGLKPLEKDFVQNGQYPFKAGERWQNPYWDGEGGTYHNVFRTSIKLGKYQTIYQVPTNVMRDVVEHWAEANGRSACEKIITSIK